MSKKLRFGVLSTANIGLKKVLPAMMKGEHTTVTAIASRDLGKALEAAKALGIEKAYGSYEELLADPDIDAVYNPLPNQLHVPWTTKAAEAGKHVLCEKPISLTVAEARTLLDVRARTGVLICEAFMIRSYHQWLRLRELLNEGRIGELRAVSGVFSYFNANPANIRNQVECGGGGVYDIGCYLIQASRYGFGKEPKRVVSLLDHDPVLGTDRLASAILDFDGGQAILTCSTQLIPYHRQTSRCVSSSMQQAIRMAVVSLRKPSRWQTNTPCKGMPLRRPLGATAPLLCRWKIPSVTWQSSRRSSTQRSWASG
jgi:predicted dehydrogenase